MNRCSLFKSNTLFSKTHKSISDISRLNFSNSSTSDINSTSDICIVGGGIVGFALATSIGILPFDHSSIHDNTASSSYLNHLSVAIIDSNSTTLTSPVHQEKNPGFSNRVSSITPSSQSFIKSTKTINITL